MRFRDYLKEQISQEHGETSISGKPSHFHLYLINKKGDGWTDKILPPPKGDIHQHNEKIREHDHKITNFSIKIVEHHTHSLKGD